MGLHITELATTTPVIQQLLEPVVLNMLVPSLEIYMSAVLSFIFNTD